MFSVPVIAGNCGLSPESGKQVSRKRGEQDVLIELGKLGLAGLSWESWEILAGKEIYEK